MKLRELLQHSPEYRINGSADVEIENISYDSRKVTEGDLFIALPGHNVHGLQFFAEAVKAGAAALLSDREVETDLPVVIVSEPRHALAKLSNAFYNRPSTELKLIGVTGTNGKTTTTFLIQSIFESAGLPCGLIGTVRYSSGKFSTTASMTTPESLDLQKLLRQMVDSGTKACAIEVSSQGLVQYRAADCHFACAIFTNLTHEHLDYHHTMDEYFKAKLMLFDDETCRTEIAISNADDPYGRQLVHIRKALGLNAITYGFGPDANYRVSQYRSEPQGIQLTITHRAGTTEIRSPLIGRYNAYNVCAAFAAAMSMRLDAEAIRIGIETMTQVPGRLERAEFGQPFSIIIDYAHTDDAFRQLLPALREHTKGRLIHIFGCGGDRDRTKRPLMGKASAELADIVVLTSDNPRTEDPEAIVAEVKSGVEHTSNPNMHVFIDRTEAIEFAVKIAEPGDTIVITGKGNETYQLVTGKKLPFNEREYFRLALEKFHKV